MSSSWSSPAASPLTARPYAALVYLVPLLVGPSRVESLVSSRPLAVRPTASSTSCCSATRAVSSSFTPLNDVFVAGARRRRRRQQRRQETTTKRAPTSMVIGRVLKSLKSPLSSGLQSDVEDGFYAPTAVVGASGNVGKLCVAKMLREGRPVRAIVRSYASADQLYDFLLKKDVCPNLPEIVVADVAAAESAVVAGGGADDVKEQRGSLETALRGMERVVICTGTTAFPTRAWAGGDVAADDVAAEVWRTFRDNSMDVRSTLDALAKRGMSTPDVVDGRGVERIAKSLDPKSAKRVVLMSSLGVTRREEFPFTILNAAGVLDAKARGEKAVRDAAESIDCEWTIVRPGQLFGGPYDNNFYLGTLLALDKNEKTRALEVHKGDVSAGDTLRSSLADVLCHALTCTHTRNMDFTVLTVEGKAPSAERLDEQIHDALDPLREAVSSSAKTKDDDEETTPLAVAA